MEFKEAYQKLQKLAAGEYNAIGFEVGTHSAACNGDIETRCSLYINGYPWTKSCGTWKEAFSQMKAMLNPHSKENEEMPNVSDKEKLSC